MMNDDSLEGALRTIGAAAADRRDPPDPKALLEAFEGERNRRGRGSGSLVVLGSAALAATLLPPADATAPADRGLSLRAQQIARAFHVPKELLR